MVAALRSRILFVRCSGHPERKYMVPCALCLVRCVVRLNPCQQSVNNLSSPDRSIRTTFATLLPHIYVFSVLFYHFVSQPLVPEVCSAVLQLCIWTASFQRVPSSVVRSQDDFPLTSIGDCDICHSFALGFEATIDLSAPGSTDFCIIKWRWFHGPAQATPSAI